MEMKKRNKILSVLLVVCGFAQVQAQDPVFSQFYSAAMFLNPALAADKQNTNFTISHRTFTNKEYVEGYNLSQFTAIVPIKLKFLNKFIMSDHQSGAGFTMYRSSEGKGGQLVSLGFIGTFAHNIQILKSHYISLGLQAAYMNRKIDDNFNWGSQYTEVNGYDPSVMPSIGDKLNVKCQYPTFNAGVVWFMNNTTMKDYLQRFKFDAFAGFSVFNLNRPNYSFVENEVTRLPVNWKLHGGLKFNVSKKFSIFPNAMLVRQNEDNQFNIGAYGSFKPKEFADEAAYNAILGLWYRAGESIIVSVGSAYYNFKFAVSYDFRATNKVSYGKGALEVSLKYTIPSQKEHLSRGQVYPSF